MQDSAEPAPDFEARRRERLAQKAPAREVLGIDPSAGESYEESDAPRSAVQEQATLFAVAQPEPAPAADQGTHGTEPATEPDELRAYALGERDTVDSVADRRATWRALEPRSALSPPTGETPAPAPGAGTPIDAPAQPAPAASDQVRSSAVLPEPAPPAPAPAEEDGSLQPSAEGPREAAAEATSPNHDGASGSKAAATSSTADQDTGSPQRMRQSSVVREQPPASGEETLPPRAPARADDADSPGTALDAAPADVGEVEKAVTQAPDKAVVPTAASSMTTPDVPAGRAADRSQSSGRAAASLAENAPTASEADEEPSGVDRVASAGQAAGEADDRAQITVPEAGSSPHLQPAVARPEGTVAASAPPNSSAAEQPFAPDLEGGSEAAGPYPDAAAYAAAHQALLRELDQHEQWLSDTPDASRAATALTDTDTLGVPGLTDLLTLQSVLGADTDDSSQRAHLAQQLGLHIHRAQLTLAKIYQGRAARTTDTAKLRDLHEKAFHGQFIAFVRQTEDGEMELGQYIQHRAQQATPQPPGPPDSTEPMPETAQDPTTMAVDPDDDIQLPVFERPGEALMTAEQAAPRLLAQVQAQLADGADEVALLAHIHGRPVYALVDDQAEAPELMLGLTAVDEAGSARAVTLAAADLETVDAQMLLAAVTAWMDASDGGGRPVLDYSPTAPAPARSQSAPDEAPQAAPGPTTPAAVAPDTAQEAAGPPAPPVPESATATGDAEQYGSDSPTARPAVASPATADQEARTEPATAAVETAAAATEADAEARPGKEQDDAGQTKAAATPAKQLGSAPAEPVEQLTALARAALTDLGVTPEATGVLTADRTVVITLQTSGNADRDRELADRLRPVLHKAVRQHPEKSLAAYRIDFQHTPQVGQGALPDTSGAQISLPRKRLIAANRAAAQIFAQRLRSDPNAELSRTYLTDERQLPAEVQQEWGLGYAPSDRAAGRWDLLTRELMAQGFSEDELLHAGLATTSSRGTLIDVFSDRIMFPIHDENQDIVGFSGRRVDRPGETEEQAKERGGPKYLNTSDKADLFHKGDLVFGLHHPAQAEALASSKGPRVSVEGSTDVIAVARAAATLPLEQRPVVGAPMGTAFTQQQLTVLRGLDTEEPRPHIAFLDADDSGRKVLLNKWDLLLKADGPTTVTTAPDAKDAAKLWEKGIEADGDGAAPVLRALEQHQPLLDAAVEAALMNKADEVERGNHAFDSHTFFERTRFVAAEAARYIHQWVQTHAPGDAAALEHAALTWAKRLHQEWSIPGFMTATAVLLGPGKHDQDYEDEVDEQALDLLAADPEGYFANDPHVRTRQSALEAMTVPTAAPSPEGAGAEARRRRPGQWPVGTRARRRPATATSPPADEPAPEWGQLVFRMILPSPVRGRPDVEYTDRTTAAYALHTAIHERLVQHSAEPPEPDRLPQPRKLGTVYGVDLSTSGDDQTSDDPTVVVWLGTARSDSLRMSYSRLVNMSGPELLAAIEWRAAQAAGLLGTPLSQTWRTAVRSILPAAFPAQPTPAQLADLLDTIAQGPDGSGEHTRRRAEQALSAYTAGHPNLALDVLAADDHIWVLRNDGSWIQEEATQQTWEELDNGFSQEAAELHDITRAAAELPPADETPMAADFTVAHRSAHEALAALGPYSIGLPGTIYEKITDLVAQIDASEPAMRRLHGPGGEQLMNRAKRCVVRILEGLATVASKIRITSLSNLLERTVARLRGQDPDEQTDPRAVRADRRMQDLAHIERDLERRMAFPTTTLAERGELQEQWIINRARWRARYEQLSGQRPEGDFLPDNGLVAGAPPVPNPIAAHELLLDRLTVRVAELRDTDPHTGEDVNPYEPTADLLNGVAWAYQQRLIGFVPTGNDPQGPLPPAQLRRAALTVTTHQNASPLTLRRTMNVTAERADRLLHRLEEQQILGPYRADAPRTVLARAADIDTLLARTATPKGPRTPPAAAHPAPTTKSSAPKAADAPEADVDELAMTRLSELVSQIIADKETRSVTGGEPEPDNGTAPASRVRKNLHKTAHQQTEDNALATGHSTPLAPSQS